MKDDFQSPGLEIIQSNPAIAYIIALNNVFMKKCRRPWRRARNLLLKKRTEIIKKAGFPADKSTVKILGKLPSHELSPGFIFFIRWLLNLNDPIVTRTLRFLPVINLSVLYMLGNEGKRNLLGFRVLEEIGKERGQYIDRMNLSMMVNDIFRMKEDMDTEINAPIMNPVQAENLHTRLCEQLNRREWRYSSFYSEKPFPEPVRENYYADDFTIEHIPDYKDLAEWGDTQKNCVASYAGRVQNGNCQIYRIKTPEEATLSIVQGNKGWEIEQLLGIKNSCVREITCIFVKEWLSEKIKGEGHTLKNFPIKESSTENWHFKPVNSYGMLLELDFSRYNSFTPEDVLIDHNVFLYEIIKPEKGILGLRKVHGQWEAVLVEDFHRNEPSDSTYQLIEDWLWENTQKGEIKQLKFPFRGNNKSGEIKSANPTIFDPYKLMISEDDYIETCYGAI